MRSLRSTMGRLVPTCLKGALKRWCPWRGPDSPEWQRRSWRRTQREMAIQHGHGWSRRRLGIIALAAALGLIIHAAPPAHAAGKSAVLVIDANTGRVLHQSAADEPRHPA